MPEQPADRDQARQQVADALRRIAPEADLSAVPDDVDLAEELDLDSMDLQELRAALHERTGVDLGGVAAEQLATLGGLITALVSSGS